MKKHLTLAGFGASLAAAAVSVVALPAADAADNTALQAGKDRCDQAIDNRHAALGELDVRVTAAVTLTAAHKDTVVATIDATTAGLDALEPAIDAATDRAALTAACHHITVDYRVYALVIPQAELAIGYDAESVAATTLDAFGDAADAIIAAERAAGKDTSAAEATLASLRTETAAASTAIDGKPDAVLTIEPAQWNADRTVLEPYRAALATAAGHLKTGRGLAHRLLDELKA